MTRVSRDSRPQDEVRIMQGTLDLAEKKVRLRAGWFARLRARTSARTRPRTRDVRGWRSPTPATRQRMPSALLSILRSLCLNTRLQTNTECSLVRT